MARAFEFTLRISLWLLFLAAAFHALLVLWVGVTFGLSLWSLRDPSPTVHWLAALLFPLLLFRLVSSRRMALKQVAILGAVAWTFAVYYVVFYLGEGHILDCGVRWSCA